MLTKLYLVLSILIKLKKYFLSNGKMFYDTPFYLSIKTRNEIDVFNILNENGIENIKEVYEQKPRENQYEFYLAKNFDSIVIMDNWYYSFYHLNCLIPFSESIGKKYDLFQFVVGDSDHSFGFKKYKHGKLIRNYQVDNPSYRKDDLRIRVDVGIPLKGENKFLQFEGEYEKTVNIAYKNGLILPSNPKSIKSYSYNPKLSAMKRNYY